MGMVTDVIAPVLGFARAQPVPKAQPVATARSHAGFYIPSLDGIRAAAVLLVFMAHAGLNDRVPGSFGVTAFFFLSGYLITTLLRMEFDRTGSVSLRAFYLRRVLRIFPPMYLVLAVASVVTLGGFMEGSVQALPLAAQSFFLSNYYIIANGWWDGRAPGTWILWSLAVEEHFYLVFPLVYLLLRRWVPRRGREALILLGLCGLVLVWRMVLILLLGADHDRTYVASDTRVDSILFGCILAVYGNPVLDTTRVSDGLWKFVLVPLGLIGLLVSFLIPSEAFGDTARYTLQGISLIPLFASAIRYPDWIIFRLLNLRAVKFVGVLSYSMYLMHPTILFFVHEWTNWNGLEQGALSLAVTLVLSTLMYHYVERPCARLRKRLSKIVAPAPSGGVVPGATELPPSSIAQVYPPVSAGVSL